MAGCLFRAEPLRRTFVDLGMSPLQPSDVAEMVLVALRLARTAEVTEISMRPLVKSY